jgi:hypothetical protein
MINEPAVIVSSRMTIGFAFFLNSINFSLLSFVVIASFVIENSRSTSSGYWLDKGSSPECPAFRRVYEAGFKVLLMTKKIANKVRCKTKVVYNILIDIPTRAGTQARIPTLDTVYERAA